MNKTQDLKPQITTDLERKRERAGFLVMGLEREGWVFGQRELGFWPKFRERESWVFGHEFREFRERESWDFGHGSIERERERERELTFSQPL